MGYEIDFLGVGEESKSGDAIALRYGLECRYESDREVQAAAVLVEQSGLS